MSTKMVTTLREVETIFKEANVGKEVLDKISVWRGDITKLEIDAIVNAANSRLAGGGGVDAAIHKAAGYHELQAECKKFGGCAVGNTVATSACKLTHVKKILHTVGPQVWGDVTKDHRVQLLSCYATALELAVEHGLRSIAFPCISTGIYGYPNDDAAHSVMNYLCKFFLKSQHKDKIDRVVLCLFLPVDVDCYGNECKNLEKYFTEWEARNGKKDSQEAGAEESTQSQPKKVKIAMGPSGDATENEGDQENAVNDDGKLSGTTKGVVHVVKNEGEKAPLNSPTKL